MKCTCASPYDGPDKCQICGGTANPLFPNARREKGMTFDEWRQTKPGDACVRQMTERGFSWAHAVRLLSSVYEAGRESQ